MFSMFKRKRRTRPFKRTRIRSAYFLLSLAMKKRSTWVGSLLLLLPLFFVGIKKEGRVHRVEEKKKKHKRSVQLSLSLPLPIEERERERSTDLSSI